MCLEGNTVLIAEEHTRLIKELEKRKANVVSGFRMDIASRWGGGIRCASPPCSAMREPGTRHLPGQIAAQRFATQIGLFTPPAHSATDAP
jgi:hypothetical protein